MEQLEFVYHHSETMDLFQKKAEPFLELMAKFGKDTEQPAQEADAKELLGHFLSNSNGLGKFYRQAIEVGAALYTSGIQYLVAETLVRNPARNAQIMNMENNEDAICKNNKNLNDLVQLLYKTRPETSSVASDETLERWRGQLFSEESEPAQPKQKRRHSGAAEDNVEKKHKKQKKSKKNN